MTDSPKSEKFGTRFSTPDAELDDHRHQPESLPRADSMAAAIANHPTRRGTRRSTFGDGPGMLTVPELLVQGTIARDFENEHAIEDDASDAGSVNRELHQNASRGISVTPLPPRQNSFWRPRNGEDRRNSVISSRSPSPPNSVDAFAEPRRRPRAGTAGTANSQVPSFMSVRPSHSIESFQRRRTYSEDKTNDASDAATSDQGSVEDDVCFPNQDLPSYDRAIDYDDLHEFVASRKNQRTHFIHPFRDTPSDGPETQKVKVFQDLRNNASVSTLPKTSIQSNTKNDSDVTDGSKSDMDEKEISIDDIAPPKTPAPRETVNRWSFFSSELEETIHAPELGDLLMPGETFEHLFKLGPEGGVWWLDMLMPSEEEVEAICKAFNIHGLTREDIITQETREKVELFKSYYFVCFRSFYQMDKSSEYYMEPVNVYAIVFREGILTFTFCPSPHAANVRKRMGKLRDYVALGSDWICYALIDDIVDTFQPVIQTVEHESEAIEDDIFTARAEDSRAVLRHIGECRKKVMSLIRLLGGKADVIKGFAKRCNEQFSIAPRQDVGMYLSDIQDHVVTMMSNLGHFEKMLSRSHSNYLAQISVDNIAQGNKANKALSKVTVLATILVPLNLITGLFGMNVHVPGEDVGGFAWFSGIVGCLALFVVLTLFIARKRRIL